MTLCNLVLKRQQGQLSIRRAEGLGRSFALSSNLQVWVQVTELAAKCDGMINCARI